MTFLKMARSFSPTLNLLRDHLKIKMNYLDMHLLSRRRNIIQALYKDHLISKEMAIFKELIKVVKRKDGAREISVLITSELEMPRRIT